MKKPSEIKCVEGRKTYFLPPNFRTITLFGIVYCQSELDVKRLNESDNVDSVLKCHETIHVRQAESVDDSWFKYYLRYIWQWLCNLPLIFINFYAPYRFTPFEIEAYKHERYYTYPSRGTANEWREYETLSLKQKREMAKEYYKKG